MPIDKKLKAADLAGRRVTNDRLFQTIHHGIQPGWKFTIIAATRNLLLKSDACPHCGQYAIVITKRDFVTLLDDDPLYRPNCWNKYPDVKPPFDVSMRVESSDGRKFCASFHKFADGACWVNDDGTVMPKALSDSICRYQPWEDI